MAVEKLTFNGRIRTAILIFSVIIGQNMACIFRRVNTWWWLTVARWRKRLSRNCSSSATSMKKPSTANPSFSRYPFQRPIGPLYSHFNSCVFLTEKCSDTAVRLISGLTVEHFFMQFLIMLILMPKWWVYP